MRPLAPPRRFAWAAGRAARSPGGASLILVGLFAVVTLAQDPAPAVREKAESPANPVLATVDGEPITLEMYQRYLWITEGTRKLDELVNRLLIEREADRLGVAITYERIDQIVEEKLAEVARVYRGDRAALEKNIAEHYGSLSGYRRWLRDRLLWDAILDACIRKTRTVTPEMIEAAFQKRYGAGGVRVRLRHILIANASATGDDFDDASPYTRARRIKERAEAGDDFVTLAALYSDDTTSAEVGGEITLSQAARYGPRFMDQVRSIAPRGSVELVQSPQGWHVVEHRGETRTELAEVRSELTKELETASPTAEERRAFIDRLRSQATIERK